MWLKTRLCAIFMSIALPLSAVENTPVANTATGNNIPIKVQSNTVEIGYQIGDIAHQTVIIHTPKGYHVDKSSLPAKGKGAAYMELRDAQWKTQEIGNVSQHQFDLDWQIFRVMQETRAYSLKPLDLQFRNKVANDKALTVHVNAASVLVASVLPTAMDAEHATPLDDIAPPLRNTRPMVAVLWISFIGLLLSSLYFAWRFDWLPAKLTALFIAPKPLKSAYREIKALQKTGETSTQIAHAMRSLRHACDATAGATLSLERVALLFERNKKLMSKRTEIERFYAESERCFFAGSNSALTLNQLMQLSRELMVLESV